MPEPRDGICVVEMAQGVWEGPKEGRAVGLEKSKNASRMRWHRRRVLKDN